MKFAHIADTHIKNLKYPTILKFGCGKPPNEFDSAAEFLASAAKGFWFGGGDPKFGGYRRQTANQLRSTSLSTEGL